MSLLKRRTDTPEPAEVVNQVVDEPPKSGKGRPTPKRSEARAARAKGGGALKTPTDRKEARTQARAQRRRQSMEYRAAMASGDVNRLPPRERAPERVIARDFVDSRINIGTLFMPVAVLYVVGGFVPNQYVNTAAIYFMIVGILAVVVDSIVLGRQVTRLVAEKHPDSQVKVRAYAAQRALLFRRWRMPKPRVDRHGDRL